MERYKQISNEHAHEFNASQEMRQTQELLDEDSHSSIMGSKDISSLVREVPRLLAFIEQHDLGTSYQISNFKMCGIYQLQFFVLGQI